MGRGVDRRLTLLSVAAAMVAVVVAVYAGTPTIMNHITIVDAERHSISWLRAMTREFDLPGEPPQGPVKHRDLISLFVGEPDTDAVDKTVNVFRPSSFEVGHHLGSVRGYVVFTRFGDRFVAGGEPIERTLDRPALRQRFEATLADGEPHSFINRRAEASGHRIVSVMIPLLRSGRTNAVAMIDVERTEFEQELFRGIRRGAVAAAITICVVALGVLALLLTWGRAREAAEDEASFLALHDALTGLPNRRQFNARFPALLGEARDRGAGLALLCVDVDRFKDINDVYGHLAGDQLLVGLGRRLEQVSGSAGLVFRLSGDEFTILLPGIDGPDAPNRVCEAILEAQREPMLIDGHRVVASLSIGVALFATDGETPEDLLKHADLALYKAKSEGRNRHRFFAPEMDTELRRRRRIQNNLRVALHANEFEVHYQPQIDTASGQLKGFEALLRWTHPEDGPIPPQDFIPVAEESGLIGRIGAWVLHTACREAAQWPEPFDLAVNLSPAQFEDGDIVAEVRQALEQSGLDPTRLELEITEGVLLNDVDKVAVALRALRGLGVGIAMDDFGTGYSSLSYLTRIPLTKIKIDRSFVRQLGADPNVDAIVNSIIGIGRSLKVAVTAEGVETFDQLRGVQATGCHLVQGFLYGRPSRDPFASPIAVRALHADIERRLAG